MDNREVMIGSDGTVTDRETGFSFKPPCQMEWRSNTYSPEPLQLVLLVDELELTPELISSLIDTFEFVARLMPGTRVILDRPR